MGAERTFIAITDPIRERARQAEQDAFELHQALTEAIRRLTAARRELRRFCFDPFDWTVTRTDDLLEVLERTSRPDPELARQQAERVNQRTWWIG